MACDSLAIQKDLCSYLQVIDSGKFATSGPLLNANNPGLFVKGVGKVGLPLSERDAAEIIRASHEAPFGKGSETFVDPTVRKTWELSPNQFELRNPTWPSTLHEVIGNVAQELGIIDGASSIRAELHKLLLYESGAFFDKHKDTEKASGMFATLVIALPSEHLGGDVVVQLRDEQQILKTQGLCDFNYSYLAWYADVNHSVSKIESGHRLVLTYNLIHQASDTNRMATVLDDHKQNLDKVLALWSKQDREWEQHSEHVDEKLVYILEHEYSEANICLDQLKGKDQLRARYLSEACHDQGFCLFFAHFEYSRFGGVDENEDDPYWADHLNGTDYHKLIDELETKWKLVTVFQSDGQQLAENITLEEEEILNNADFKSMEPDDEECDGWTGNEGCTATHFYHRTCAVILPRSRRLDFLSEAYTVSIGVYIDTLLREMQDETLSMASQEELKKLCEMTIDAKKTPQKPRKESSEDAYSFGWRKEEAEIKGLSRVSDKELALVGKAALALDSPDLFEEVARLTSRMLPVHIFQDLGEGLVGRDIGLWKKGLQAAMSCIPGVSERVKAMELLVSNYQEAAGDSANTQEIQGIEREVAMSMTEAGSGEVSVTAADAQTLMDLSEKYGEKYIFQVVLPLVKKHASNVEFAVAFLSGLFSAGETHKLRLEVVQNLFKDTLGDLIPNLQLDQREVRCEQLRNDFAKRRRFDYERYGPQTAEDQSSKPVTADSLTTLFHHCEKLGLSDEINKLVHKIVSHAPNANVVSFDHLFLPLLKRLPPPIEPTSKSIGTRSYNEVFRTILSTYISAYVQTPPLKPTGLERQPRGCSLYCEDCVKLNDFLKNPDTLRVKFAVNGIRRNHLVERLSGSCCSTETIKSGTPYKLIVTKTGMQWEHNMKEWKQRCKVAVKAVEDIGLDKLSELLGKGWEDVVGLRAIRAAGGEESGQRRPLGDLAQGEGTSGMVEKGQVGKIAGTSGPEIVDLDCE